MRFVNIRNQDRIEHFDNFLQWLDSDRERAGEKYNEIRRSLMKIFSWKGCSDAEFLADQTLDRVMSRVPELRKTYSGNPNSYIYAVAKRVLSEHSRTRSVQLEDSVAVSHGTTDAQNEQMYDCMKRCLSNLNPSSRDLILSYYREEHTKKLSHRKDLAENLGISLDQLRVRMYRIRKTLDTCVKACMEQEGTI